MTGVIIYNESDIKSIWADVSAVRNVISKIGVDFYIIIDSESLVPSWSDEHIECYRANDMTEALKALNDNYPECETVLLDPLAITDMKDFVHPENACYVFGCDSAGIPEGLTTDHKVKLPFQNLWAVNCMAQAFYDRSAKA